MPPNPEQQLTLAYLDMSVATLYPAWGRRKGQESTVCKLSHPHGACVQQKEWNFDTAPAQELPAHRSISNMASMHNGQILLH